MHLCFIICIFYFYLVVSVSTAKVGVQLFHKNLLVLQWIIFSNNMMMEIRSYLIFQLLLELPMSYTTPLFVNNIIKDIRISTIVQVLFQYIKIQYLKTIVQFLFKCIKTIDVLSSKVEESLNLLHVPNVTYV